MYYYGFTDEEVNNFEKSIKIPPIKILKKELENIVEYYAVTYDFSILMCRAGVNVNINEGDLSEEANSIYVRKILDEHFVPLSEELQEPATKAELNKILKLQTSDEIDAYTLDLVKNDLLK